jgi:hypothetical protein
MEGYMFGERDSAAQYSHGSTAKRYREETEEERATYRRWMRGIVAFYCVLVLVIGLHVAVKYSGAGFTQLTHVSGRPAATLPRAE